MNQVLFSLLLVGVTVCAAIESTKDGPKKSNVDVVVSRREGKEFQTLGETLNKAGKVIDEEARHPTSQNDEVAEYFLKKLFRKKIFRQIGKAGAEVGKKFLGQKAQEMIEQKMKERGHYSMEDAEMRSNYFAGISEQEERLGKDLIAKRPDLYDSTAQEKKPAPDRDLVNNKNNRDY